MLSWKWSGNSYKNLSLISSKERRFLRYWEEQREGGFLSYVLLYALIGTFITSVFFSILLVIFYRLVFGSPVFWMVISGALILSVSITLFTWKNNERYFKKIIRREIGGNGQQERD